MNEHSRKGFVIGLVLGLICLVVGFALGCWLCGREQAISVKTITKVDTVKYYKPMPYFNPDNYKIRLPMILYAPADTVVKTMIVTEKGDSTEVKFPVEQREYRDSTYRAIISGAVVGNRRPTLDYIETYNTTITSEVVVQPKKVRPYVSGSVGVFGTWSVSVGGGLLINNQHAFGVEYERTKTDNRLRLNYAYYILK